jgi:site-specific recombinase XerD
MNMETKIKSLVHSVLTELERLQYSPQTIVQYRTVYRQYERYAEEEQVSNHSVESADRWLVNKRGIDIAKIGLDSPKRNMANYQYYLPIRAMQCLTEWQLHKHLPLKKQGKLAKLELQPSFEKALESYKTVCKENGYSKAGTYGRLNRIKRMLLFFESQGLTKLEEINSDHISGFVKTQIELDSRTVAAMLSSIRCFFRQLFITGLLQHNLSEDVPQAKANRRFKIPKVWKTEDVQQLLKSIDRENPTGKRDYAILLIIARYGLRSMDVRRLKLSSLNWERMTISIVQNKTGKALVLPILHDVGWAIADYLKHGRPNIKNEYVFLTHTVPYRPYGVHSCGLNAVLAKRIRNAGITLPRELSKGVHALRHTLASTMLAQNVSLPVISSVLGHSSMKATETYLHTDIARLKDCVLDPEELLYE